MIIPRSMITAITLNGTMGFGLLVAVLFCMGPVDGILSSEFFFPFVIVFQKATNSTAGAIGMVDFIFCHCLRRRRLLRVDRHPPYNHDSRVNRPSCNIIPHALGFCKRRWCTRFKIYFQGYTFQAITPR